MSQKLATDADGRLLIDVRGPRFGAAITTVVLSTALVVQGPVGIGLVAWQWVMFAISTFAGLAWSPYGQVFRWVKRRFDLGPPPEVEHEGPPRFAQACGFGVATVALALFASGLVVAGWVAVGVVLALSMLLATAGICVGCELYLVGQRLRVRGLRARGAGSSDRITADGATTSHGVRDGGAA